MKLVSEKMIFENGEQRRRQMPKDAYTISLPCEPNAGEQKALLMIRRVSKTEAFKTKLHTNTEIRSYNDLFAKFLQLP